MTSQGDTITPDALLSEVGVDQYRRAGHPRRRRQSRQAAHGAAAIELVRDFMFAKKPVAAICHGPWLLAEAEALEGRTVTSWPSIRTDLKHAGAIVVDREVVVDDNLITSRKPEDIPAFNRELLAKLEKAKQEA
jgi:protease I